MSEDTIDYKKLAEALAEALEQRNLWIEGEEYRELVILRMRLSARVDSLAEELKAANAHIAELEAERKKAFDLVRKLRMYCIYANWDNPDTEDEFNEFDAEVCEYLSEYKVCVDQLTAHDATERQDDKSPNDTQTQTIVYGKECEE